MSTTIHYSKYKTTALFYSTGKHIVTITEEDTLILNNASGKTYVYDILSAVQEGNDICFFLKNSQGGALGYFKMMPFGKGEIRFDTGRTAIKLKI